MEAVQMSNQIDFGKHEQNQLEQLKQENEDILASNKVLKHQLEQYSSEADAANHELESFLYTVSHDLRSPLRSITGFSQALMNDYQNQIDDTGKDYLRRIYQAGRKMNRLIEGLVKLSSMMHQRMYIQQVDLSKMAQSIYHEYQDQISDRNISFKVNPGMSVQGDRSLLDTMLRHLMDNAIKFTSEKTDTVIEFDCFRKNGKQVYAFRDNGIGFDMTYHDQLFAVFQRQHVQFQGTGIGLAIVKRIIQKHGGKIWAEGQENQGAVFYFTLSDNPSVKIGSS